MKRLHRKFKEGGPRVMDIIKSIEHEQLKNKILIYVLVILLKYMQE